MKRKLPGVVIHLSSFAGQSPFFLAPLYVASKHAISGFVRSLERLEFPARDIPKVRVSAVAPGLVKTPLWTENPERLALLPEDDPADSFWVTPEFVAEAMLELVQSEKYLGGTILEVGKTVRKVGAFNDPGPPVDPKFAKHIPQTDVEADIWAPLEKVYQG